MLNRKQLFAVAVVRNLHRIAGWILDGADAIEGRVIASYDK